MHGGKHTAEERGFTLVELLVVIAIIGLLAAVALSQYAMYKQKAVDAKMEASLHGARQAMEGYYASVSPPSYVGATEANLSAFHGYRASVGVSLSIPVQTQTNYLVRVCATGGTSSAYQYDASVGVMVQSSSPCS